MLHYLKVLKKKIYYTVYIKVIEVTLTIWNLILHLTILHLTYLKLLDTEQIFAYTLTGCENKI